MTLTSRVVAVVDDEGRLVEVVEGCFGPAAAVDAALVVVVFLSKVEVAVEGLVRLAGAGGEPALAAAELGRILAEVLGLVAPAAGCNAGSKHKKMHGGKIKRDSKGKGQIKLKKGK